MTDGGIDTDSLWTIFSYIGTQWPLAKGCDMPESQFVAVLNWQVGLDPTYVGYYSDTVAEYQALLQHYGQAGPAIQALYAQNTIPGSDPIGTHVLLEFFRWYIAFGAFRGFGYVNYTGWMGGGSYLAIPPPYRSWNGEGEA